MFFFTNKARDITAMSLDKLIFFETTTMFGFNPSISTSCLDSRGKPNLLSSYSFAFFNGGWSLKWLI